MNRNMSKWYKMGLEMLILAGACALTEYLAFGLSALDWSVPMLYGGDGITGVKGISNILKGTNTLLGWPFYAEPSPYQANYSMLYRLFVRACGMFTKNAGLVFNLYVLSIPFANVLICYPVLRSMKIRRWLSGAAALTFGFCPYVQTRLGGHMGLAACECVPLVVLLCFWCTEDERFNQPGKGFFRYRRNWLGLLFAWMVANNGMVYYPYFACFFLCIVAVCQLLGKRNNKTLIQPVVTVCEIAGWLAVAFVPTIVGILAGAGNTATAGADRGSVGGDIYSLRISSLLLSPKGWGIPKIAEWVGLYRAALARDEGILFNENAGGYLGIVATIGFLLLLVLVFWNGRQNNRSKKVGEGTKTQTADRLWLLSRMNVAALILCVISGFGAILAIVVRMIRGYNRISGYLAFLGILAATLCAEQLLKKQAVEEKPYRKCLVTVAIAALFLYGFWEQQGYFRPDYVGVQTTWQQDAKFVQQIEQISGSDAMVFQLPYMKSFENGPQNKMADYTLLRGPLHSDTLRWSYGAAVGSVNDLWYQETSELNPENMVAELKAQGITGIYLDLDGYQEREGQALKKQLCQAANCIAPIISEGGTLCYIPVS